MNDEAKKAMLACLDKGDLAQARLLVEISSLNDNVLIRGSADLITTLAADCEQLLSMCGQMHSLVTDVAAQLGIDADVSVAGMDQMLIEVQRVVYRARGWAAQLVAMRGG